MGKIFIEDTEIIITERREETNDGEHVIGDEKYIMRFLVKTVFESSIFSYDNEKVLVGRTNRFNDQYYKIVLFDDKSSKAWNIIELYAGLEIKVKRMAEDRFFIVGDNKNAPNITAQVSFCKLKPSTKVEEITINFNKFNDVHFFKNEIVVCYDDVDEATGKVFHTLAMYTDEGKLTKTLYEFNEEDPAHYRYEVKDNEVIVFKTINE